MAVIKGKMLYSLPTDALTGFSQKVLPETLSDKALAAKIKQVGENGPADGLIIGRDNKMYVSSPQSDSVKVRDLSAGGSPTVLLKDAQLRWPDTFSEGADGTLYLTTSHLLDSAFYKLGAPIALPTRLMQRDADLLRVRPGSHDVLPMRRTRSMMAAA